MLVLFKVKQTILDKAHLKEYLILIRYKMMIFKKTKTNKKKQKPIAFVKFFDFNCVIY